MDLKVQSVVFGSYEQFLAFRNELQNYYREDFEGAFPALQIITSDEERTNDYPIYIGHLMSRTAINDKECNYVIIKKDDTNV